MSESTLRAALQEAVDALAGGLWDYGPGQSEHERCDEVIERCRAVLAAPVAAQEPDELRRAVRAMVSMMNDREWGEHVSRDPDASDLESAITTLIGELSGNVADKSAEPKPYWIPCHVCGQAFNQSAGLVHCPQGAGK